MQNFGKVEGVLIKNKKKERKMSTVVFHSLGLRC